MAEKDHVIISTAGHIDHGKTALVKALTGIDADTLPEEKARGMTIDLGFVFMDDAGCEKQIVFIDVPGHEKFVRTMVAGASNVDTCMLVIAADEGISVQTREHFDILQVLGLERGVIAVTKSDLAGRERLSELESQIKDFTSGTFLESAEIIPVSSVTGDGIGRLKSALSALAQAVHRRSDSGIFRMPIDRVFIMEGFGTVIAGTVLSGKVSVGDTVEILPEGMTAKVRGIHIHKKPAESSGIGKRTAINLQNVRKEDLERGHCAAAPGSLKPTRRLDARISLLKGCKRPVRNRERLRLHIGTAETISRLVLLENDLLMPGESALAQFVLESPVVALPKDRFVIRTFSPLFTVGGGIVIDTGAGRHKRHDADAPRSLESMEGPLEEAVEQVFRKAGYAPQDVRSAALAVGEDERKVGDSCASLCGRRKLVAVQAGRYIHADNYGELSKRVMMLINGYFGKNPYRLFAPFADIQSDILRLTDKPVFDMLVSDLCRSGRIGRRAAKVWIEGREILAGPADKKAAETIERAFMECGFSPPAEEEILRKSGIDAAVFGNIMTALYDKGTLVKLADKITYHSEYLGKAKDYVRGFAPEHGGISVAQLRDGLGISRKYALAVLEHLDGSGFTRRSGDSHIFTGNAEG